MWHSGGSFIGTVYSATLMTHPIATDPRSYPLQFLKRLFSVLLLLLVFAYGLFFAVQNTATAPLDVLFTQLDEQRIALWILLAFAFGGVLGMLLSTFIVVRLRGEALLARRQLKLRDRELDTLRSTELLVSNLAADRGNASAVAVSS
ncbi:MAG: putative membrane protein [Paraglaciecola psychrophila]|jgi:putative membrane protein